MAAGSHQVQEAVAAVAAQAAGFEAVAAVAAVQVAADSRVPVAVA